MSRFNRRHGLLAGLALILLINAFALAGVWYNRSGEPDSRLPLSERELSRGYQDMRENSGLSLQLQWRMLASPDGDLRYNRRLDEAQMRQLGFPAPDAADCTPRCRRQAEREVLVVLELDGPAYREALRRQQERLEQARQALAALPEDKPLAQRRDSAQRELDQLERDTRLYAVDVGRDRDALRQRYPDRQRYAIVHGLVRPSYGERQLNGYLRQLSIEQINVPQRWRPQLGRLPVGRSSAAGTPQQRIEVAFGQRLEPWISAVAAGRE